MFAFLTRRLLQAAVVLLVMSFVIYGLIGLMPGDPVDIMAASMPGMTPEVMKNLRAIYGLDQPLMLRYARWLMAILSGDFGFSRTHSRPVLEVLTPALLQTCKLMLISFFLSVVISVVLGVISALKPGGWLDTLIGFVAFAGISIPVFWLALILIIAFAVTLQWLPASGMGKVGDYGFWDQARHLILPVTTLTLANAGQFTRYVRAAMIETLQADYIRTARAKGLAPPRVILLHALRNALVPVVTIMALSFGTLFSGALVTETMFAQMGMGKMIFDSILSNDFNLALTGLLFATLVTLLSNLAADVAYSFLDPRITLK
ncbi:ABC transporter permease [Terrarubrum flagellatum]|uniref:ABC transporter permease n=1 Tax=Terrirubrum flagellatum TaxID=2895980 RepID=UPI0031452E01